MWFRGPLRRVFCICADLLDGARNVTFASLDRHSTDKRHCDVIRFSCRPSFWVRVFETHKMRRMKVLSLALAPFAIASLLVAQTPPPGAPGGAPPRGQQGAVRRTQSPSSGTEGMLPTRIQRLADALKLTPDQRQKARQLFRDEANAMRTAARQARNAREALQDVVHTGASDSEIDRLAQAAGAAHAQVEAIRVKTMTKFYAMLNQDQKDLFDEHGGRLMEHHRMGPRPGGPGRRAMGPPDGLIGPDGGPGQGMRGRGGPPPREE